MRWIIVLGFANKLVANRSLELLEATATSDARVVIVDNHYPLDPPDWERWAKRLGGIYLDPEKNLGLHGGLNWALTKLGATQHDQMIGFDPDTRPITKGWDSALFAALRFPRVGWASLWNEHSGSEIFERGYEISIEENFCTYTIHKPVMNSICAFNLDWVKECGGFQEPTEFYGGLECCMWNHLSRLERRWVFLKDFLEGTFGENLHDDEYMAYKWAHAHEGLKGSFDKFLEDKCKNP